MDGWMNGWMDEWMGVWMDGWVFGWMDGCDEGMEGKLRTKQKLTSCNPPPMGCMQHSSGTPGCPKGQRNSPYYLQPIDKSLKQAW